MRYHVLLLCIGSIAIASSYQSDQSYPTFYAWQQACNTLPDFDPRFLSPNKTILTPRDLHTQLDQFFGITTRILTKQRWHGAWPTPAFYSLSRDLLEPYVQKLRYSKGSIVAVHGDLHGDVHALNTFIAQCARDGFMDKRDPFKIVHPRFHMLFLGDYTDRGWYGAETIYTILRLKNANPDRVWMVRGNHEDQSLNDRYGFSYELQEKFHDASLMKKIYRVYNFLPLACYMRVGRSGDMIQCCHGGIELGFDPRSFMVSAADCMVIEQLNRAAGYALLKQGGIKGFDTCFADSQPIDCSNGFMWSDFIVDPLKAFSRSARDGYAGTIFEFGRLATEILCTAWRTTTHRIQAIFRAHQHSPKRNAMMQRIYNEDKLGHPHDAGVAKLWITDSKHRVSPGLLEGIRVVTFSVAPRTGYGVPYQSYGLLYVGDSYEQSHLRVIRLFDEAKESKD